MSVFGGLAGAGADKESFLCVFIRFLKNTNVSYCHLTEDINQCHECDCEINNALN